MATMEAAEVAMEAAAKAVQKAACAAASPECAGEALKAFGWAKAGLSERRGRDHRLCKLGM